MKLNERQKKFVDYYVESSNITESAIKAGYSEKYANALGYKLLGNLGISAYLKERLEKVESERIAKPVEVLQYLTSVLRGQETEPIPLLMGEGKQSLASKEIGAKERIKAAELLGKRYLLFSDRLNVDGAVSVNFEGESCLED